LSNFKTINNAQQRIQSLCYLIEINIILPSVTVHGLPKIVTSVILMHQL